MENKFEMMVDIHEAVCEMKGVTSNFKKTIEEILSVVPNPIIAGGFALANYTKPRATTDLDVVGFAGLKTYAATLLKMGYKQETVRFPHLTLEQFTKGKDHEEVGIDFMSFENEAFEKSILSRAKSSTLYGHPVRIVSLEDLIVMKLLSSRTKDKADLEELQKVASDSAYIRKWISLLRA